MQIKDALGVEGTEEDPVPVHGNPAMSAPPKTKPPPPKESDGESDEGSETSDEETEGEEQGEGGSDFESESDKGTDAIKKKLTSILPSKQQIVEQSAVKASATVAPAAGAGIPSKRIREVNGKREKEDEPQSKKKRLEVATPAAKSAALKRTSPLSDKKKDGASKATSFTAAKRSPSKDSTADRGSKKPTEMKLQSSAAKSDASLKPSKSNTSEKTAKPSRQEWLPDEELALSKEIQKDRAHDAYGAQLPSARADPYWEKLMSRLSFMEKYENEYRVERLCEKVRRMRLRYDSLLTRMKAGETNVWRSDHEGWRSDHEGWRSDHEGWRSDHEGWRSDHEGWRSDHEGWRSDHEGWRSDHEGWRSDHEGWRSDHEGWRSDHEGWRSDHEGWRSDHEGWRSDHEGKLWRIWHTIWGPLKATPDMPNGDGDEEEGDESEEDEESEEEDEEDNVEPTQAKGRQLSSASASAQKKALSRKEAQSSSDDDDSHKETPVKVTLLAAPAVPTAEGKEPLASKSVPAKDPAPKAMEMETSQRVVVQNGAQDAPAVASVRNVVLSDELRAENLAFIRDMRDICVKLVEEAKTQSLLISEGILEEVRAKTTQIVEDATEKSSRIMEELRMVLKRLGAIAGQDEWMNSSGTNYSGNLLQGGSALQWGSGVMGLRRTPSCWTRACSCTSCSL